MKKSVHIFGVPLDSMSAQDVHALFRERLNGDQQTSIATVNPEMLLAAKRNPLIGKTLRAFSYRIPDGFGIRLVSAFLHGTRLERHPGVDLFLDLNRIAAEEGKRVLILGGWNGTGNEAAARIADIYGTDITALSDVKISRAETEWIQPVKLLETIQEYAPDVLAVALGGGDYDKQEAWIHDHVNQLKTVKIAIGIGGAVDMIAGKHPRAPKLFRILGLEWAWRGLIEPSRAPRIFRAVIVFPVAAFFDRIRS